MGNVLKGRKGRKTDIGTDCEKHSRLFVEPISGTGIRRCEDVTGTEYDRKAGCEMHRYICGTGIRQCEEDSHIEDVTGMLSMAERQALR
jgi:hypothetical protein